MLFAGLLLDYFEVSWFVAELRLFWYLLAYFIVGKDVVLSAIKLLFKGGVFNEFFLMSLATFGALYLGEYAEAVAVMLFYTVGEQIQHRAVHRARKNIKDLLDQGPEELTLLHDEGTISKPAKQVSIGETVVYRPGEKVALDGILMGEEAAFDTSSSTGESMPKRISPGDSVSAGFLVLDKSIHVEVTHKWDESATAKIVKMVETAAERKSKSQRFIRAFARVYTPIVVMAAICLVFLPSLLLDYYDFELWLYRAMVFLVISCPCALVISIPLGYFGGLGAAAKNGIFLKGANYLDVLAKVDTMLFDKTGTLTEKKFEISHISFNEGPLSSEEVEKGVFTIASHSSHPISQAIAKRLDKGNSDGKVGITEVAGLGLRATLGEKVFLLGNTKLLQREGVTIPEHMELKENSWTGVAVDGVWMGYFSVNEKIKKEAFATLLKLRELGVQKSMILSGDSPSKVEWMRNALEMDQAFGGLLPEDKLRLLEKEKKTSKTLAYVGDGINDAPVLTLADVGIAMGQSGTDIAVEAADVVIQDDSLEKIPLAIGIGRKTRVIVWQNILLALGVKLLVLALGASGMASLWEAIFADVGVALLAIGNSIRVKNI